MFGKKRLCEHNKNRFLFRNKHQQEETNNFCFQETARGFQQEVNSLFCKDPSAAQWGHMKKRFQKRNRQKQKLEGSHHSSFFGCCCIAAFRKTVTSLTLEEEGTQVQEGFKHLETSAISVKHVLNRSQLCRQSRKT